MLKRLRGNLILIVACFLLILSVLRLVRDLNFYFNKKEATAQIVSARDSGIQKPFIITVKYFNEYLQREVQDSTSLKKSYGPQLKNDDGHAVVLYSDSPGLIYLKEYQSPGVGEVVLDVVFILLFSIVSLPNRVRAYLLGLIPTKEVDVEN